LRNAGFILLWGALGQFAVAATVAVVPLALDQNFEAPRWMFDPKAKISGNKLTQLMVEAKKGQLAKSRAGCIGALEKSYALGKSLGQWLALTQLQCAQFKDKSGKAAVAALSGAVAKVDAQPRWLLTGPASAQLRANYVGALLMLAEIQSKSDRSGAWKTIDKLAQVKNWMSLDERANTYRWAGELAFIEQNLLVAQDFLTRSLGEKESNEIRTRVDSIRLSLLKKKGVPPPPPPSAEKSDDVGISDEEREISERMKRSYDSKDYVSAVEDGIQLLQKFPGSKRSMAAAELVLDVYLAIANRADEKFRNVRASVVKEMEKADAGRLSRWANNAYARGNYLDALALAEKSYEKFNGQIEATKVLLLAGKAAVAAGEYSEAQTHFEKLIKLHGGTPEAAEGAFRLGLLEFRRKKYSQATTYFERVLALNSGTDFEYRSQYWQWRAQQKLDAEKAGAFAKALAAKYPFSYYGLRAQAELNKSEVKLAAGDKPIKTDMRLLEGERLTWERFLILLKAGWFKEAEKELESLPEAQSNEERLIRAKLWALTMRYDLAIQDVSKAIEEEPALAQTSVLKVVFPLEYSAWIEKEAKSSGVSPIWIRSLIRQESSFRPEVKSPANALGLMQILPTTGAELARDLRIKDYQSSDALLIPEINIKIGSYYLARLLRNFNGNVPLALAAYNAGPTRLRRWLGARKDLGLLESPGSSSPEVEIWLDELPWEETSFYVKSILRNWIVYQLLDGSKLSLSEPLWVDAKPPPR
jgi:soluble lytic murein transglycosylase